MSDSRDPADHETGLRADVIIRRVSNPPAKATQSFGLPAKPTTLVAIVVALSLLAANVWVVASVIDLDRRLSRIERWFKLGH